MKNKAAKKAENAAPSKGRESRSHILNIAVRLASIKGLEGLSIGDLASEAGMSKSGLYAHFKSKEELELAIIETALEIFKREVIAPAMQEPAGLQRLRSVVEYFLSHLEREIFPGGCFFAATAMELDTRPGPTRDRVQEVIGMWFTLLQQCFQDAIAQKEISASTDVEQMVFETESMMLTANFIYAQTQEKASLARARNGVDAMIKRLRSV